MSTEDTGRIRVVKAPYGESDDDLQIRRIWIGCVLPCSPIMGYVPDERNLFSDKGMDKSRCGVSVPQKEALEILAAKSSTAGEYWKKLGFPHDGEFFFFAEDEIEIVSGVTYQSITEVTDEMRSP